MVSHIFTTYNVTTQVERREFLVRDKMEKEMNQREMETIRKECLCRITGKHE